MNYVSDVLEQAREVIKDPDHWCQRSYARDVCGVSCSTLSGLATKWCASGALFKVSSGTEIEHHPTPAVELLDNAANHLGFGDAISLNDGTNVHAKVIEMFDIAIERAQDDDEEN